MGIEHPAVVGYELEIAGVPIVQTRQSDRRMLALDLRVDEPGEDLQQPDGEEASAAPRASPRVAIGGDALRGLGRRSARTTHRFRADALGGAAVHALGRRLARTASHFRAPPLRRALPRRSGAELLRSALAPLPDRGAAADLARGALEPMAARGGAFLAALRARRAIVAAWLALAAVLAAVVAILLGAHAGAVHPRRGAHEARAPTPPARTVGRRPAPASPAPGAPSAPSVQLAGSSGGSAAPVRVSLAARHGARARRPSAARRRSLRGPRSEI